MLFVQVGDSDSDNMQEDIGSDEVRGAYLTSPYIKKILELTVIYSFNVFLV